MTPSSDTRGRRGGRRPGRGRSGSGNFGGPPGKGRPTHDPSIAPLHPTDVPPDIETFRHWNLGEPLQLAIEAMGIVKPTPIQRLAIQPVLDGRDVIAKAETGTGKTLAFGAPMMAKIDPARSTVLGLVLCPTRELAEQVQKVLAILGSARGVKTALIVGGEPLGPQVDALKGGAQVVVGTPGRVLDLYKQRFLQFPWTEFAILDEADVMLEIGFIDDVKQILSYTPDERQTLLFSATFPPELLKLAREYTRNPAEVATSSGVKTVDTITQSWMELAPDDQALALVRLIEQSAPEDVFLVFCPRRTEVDRLMRRLERFPFPIKALHGGYDQEARFRVMSAFRKREVKALLATDVASRGLDVAHVTHVVNLGSPQDITDYTHRIGRTGRAGRSGAAITIVSGRDMLKWKRVLRDATWTIPQVDPPGPSRGSSRPGRSHGGRRDDRRGEERAPFPSRREDEPRESAPPHVEAESDVPPQSERREPRERHGGAHDDRRTPRGVDAPRRDERAREPRTAHEPRRSHAAPRREESRGAWPEDHSTERSAGSAPHEWSPRESHQGGSMRSGDPLSPRRPHAARESEPGVHERPRAERAPARPERSARPNRDDERRERAPRDEERAPRREAERPRPIEAEHNERRAPGRGPRSEERAPRISDRTSRAETRAPRADDRVTRAGERAPRAEERAPRTSERAPRAEEPRTPRAHARDERSDRAPTRTGRDEADVPPRREPARPPRRREESTERTAETPREARREPAPERERAPRSEAAPERSRERGAPSERTPRRQPSRESGGESARSRASDESAPPRHADEAPRPRGGDRPRRAHGDEHRERTHAASREESAPRRERAEQPAPQRREPAREPARETQRGPGRAPKRAQRPDDDRERTPRGGFGSGL